MRQTMLEDEVNLNLCSWGMATHVWLQNKLSLLSFQVGGMLLTGGCCVFSTDLHERTGNIWDLY